jgi:hypothetical protein
MNLGIISTIKLNFAAMRPSSIGSFTTSQSIKRVGLLTSYNVVVWICPQRTCAKSLGCQLLVLLGRAMPFRRWDLVKETEITGDMAYP